MKEPIIWGVFDERQGIMRARAYKWGFITLCVSLFVYMYGLENDWSWMEPMIGCGMCVILGLGVFSCICVYGGAYGWMDSRRGLQALLFGALGAGFIYAGVLDPFLFLEGKLRVAAIRLETGAFLVVMCVIALIQLIRERRREKDDRG